MRWYSDRVALALADRGMSGQQYLTAQSLWKENKSGGRRVAAVFIADISGSMKGDPLASLQESVVAALPYIGSENYVGLVSYSTDVTINLSMLEKDEKGDVTGLKPFDDRQRAYFSGEIKNLQASGNTATYDAVLVGLDMINQAQQIEPGPMDVRLFRHPWAACQVLLKLGVEQVSELVDDVVGTGFDGGRLIDPG